MNFYAARQPILDRDKSLVGYELLFRDGLDNVFPQINDDQATSRLIEGSQFTFGLEELTGDKPAYINFSLETLAKGYATTMGSDEIVVEILETVQPSQRLLALIKDLKERGYTLALDDYKHQNEWRHFYPYIDIIKIDYLQTPVEQIEEVIETVKPFPHIKLLAEKVETHEQYQHAMDLGFSLFQGFFFSKPEIVQSKALPPSELTLAELLYQTLNTELDLAKITAVFERDVNLSYKLLRYSNSAMFKRRTEITSINQALVVLGDKEIKKFLSLLYTAQLSSDKPAELIRLSLTRARFAEILAKQHAEQIDSERAFLTAIMSLLDAILDLSMNEVVERLPLADDIKEALLHGKGELGDYLALVEQYEHAQWQEANATIDKMKLDAKRVPDAYHEAILWAQEQMKAIM
ncbi:EAL and HDOD domain-containing protein [Pseudoalteromonas sp. T1lg22]|uniref:EAL and HDOD domain-containing protein n=1 Tax=Pseudoalteromonas sp. T1lg22 TaxID=2077096 RepID=UPI000CF66D80|nr:HDOD domain-containing protein [Pseudoalteromonas sp. T1lg22]